MSEPEDIGVNLDQQCEAPYGEWTEGEAEATMAEIARLCEKLDEAYDMILNYLQDVDKGQNLSDNDKALWRLRSAFEEASGVI